MERINIDKLLDKFKKTVENHYLGNGAYARFLWQNPAGTRKMGINEYGCADAMNILYMLGEFPTGNHREQCLNALLSLQDKETGLFIEETHHKIHTTAHCTAAIELFDAVPLYPQTELKKYFTNEGFTSLIESLNWNELAWSESHQGAGIFVIATLTGNATLDWRRYYFDYLTKHCDENVGMSKKGTVDMGCPQYYHLNGWFHYTFNYEYARMPQPYPEKLIDTCIRLYDERETMLSANFGRIGFNEIDWVYVINRCSRQTPHRFYEVKERLEHFADWFFKYLDSVDTETDDVWNDLHSLFGTLCAIAELQSALPGKIESTKPLRLVLDRRPFI